MRGLNKLSEHETSTPLNIFATKATAPTTKNSTKSLKLSNPTTNITRRTPPVTRSQVPKRKETNIEHHPNSTTFDDNLSETPDIQMDDPNDNDPISTTTQVNESINQPIQSNEPPQEEQLVQTLSKSQTSDEQIDYGIFNPPPASEINNESTQQEMPATNKVVNQTNYQMDKPLRSIRISQFDKSKIEQNNIMQSLIDNDLKAEMPLATLLGLVPHFRTYLSRSLQAHLVPRQGPQNAKLINEAKVTPIDIEIPIDNNLIVEHETIPTNANTTSIDHQELTTETLKDNVVIQLMDPNNKGTNTYNITELATSFAINDSDISCASVYIPATINNSAISLKYDTAAECLIISPITVDKFSLPTKSIKANLQGFGSPLMKCNSMATITANIFGKDVKFKALIHLSIEPNVIILGRPVQAHYLMTLGYNPTTLDLELTFQHDNQFYTEIIEKSKNSNITIHNMTVESTKLTNEQSQQLITAMASSILSPTDKQYFMEKVQNIPDVFYIKGTNPGRIKPHISEPIDFQLKDHEIWQCKSIPFGNKRLSAIQLLKQMIDDKQLAHSNSPYRNPIFLIPKKDRQNFRLLIDLRELNRHTIPAAAHPPATDELLTEISQKGFNLYLDISNAFFQVRISEKAGKYTAFQTPLGLLEYRVLPQGFSNSVAIFSNLLTKILKPVAEKVLIFVDDVAILGPQLEIYEAATATLKSKLVQEHMDTVLEVLQLLQDAGLKINANKLTLAVTQATFLGYEIKPGSRTLIHDKIKTIQEMPLPTTVKALQRAMGLFNYYFNLIPAFSVLATELYDLIKTQPKPTNTQNSQNQQEQMSKTTKSSTSTTLSRIHWTDSARQKFNHLKYLLTQSPILVPLNYNHKIMINTDASEDAWAGVINNISPDGTIHMVAAYGGKFHLSEKNYTIAMKELYAIYLTLQHTHHLLYGITNIIYVFCDSKSVVQLLNAPFNNSHVINRLAKWLNYIRLFNLKILHIKGEQNIIADAISRMHDKNHQSSDVNSLLEEIQKFEAMVIPIHTVSIDTDTPHYKGFAFNAIKEYLLTTNIPSQYASKQKAFIHRAREFMIDNDELYKLASKGNLLRKVITDETEIQQLFHTVHDERGHLKLTNACNYINTLFYVYNLWPKLQHYIKSCEICQHFDKPPNQYPPPLSKSSWTII